MKLGAGAARVSLVEDQVQHAQNCAQPRRLLVAGRHPERDARCLDALLRPRDALGHGCLVHEEGTGDFRGCKSADRPQRQCDRRGVRQCGMAAHEQNEQRVVLVGDRWRWRVLQRRNGLAAFARLLASQLVDHPALGGLDQPPARLRGNSVTGPVQGGRQQRFLDGVLGSVEVAIPADERAEDLRRQLAQQVVDVGC
jgi:hypothetical protein